MRRIRGLFPVGVIGLCLVAAVAEGSGIGFGFQLNALPFQYTVQPGPGGVVGTITIVHGVGSTVGLQKLDLGSDGVVGGGGGAADTPLDLANISASGPFDAQLQGDVVKLGANNYKFEATLKITDTSTSLSNAPVVAHVSDPVMLVSGFLAFDGILSVDGANDAILLPGPGSSWQYSGVAASTGATPNEDTVQGQVTQSTGRAGFGQGILNGGYYTGSPSMTLDTFFGSNRSSTSVNLGAVIVPEPAVAVGLLMLLTVVARRRTA